MTTPRDPPVQDGLAQRGKHWRLWVGTDGVVRCMLEGDQDAASVERLLEALANIAAKVPERPLRLLYYGHRAVRLAPEARERLVAACRAHVNLRLAIVRASPFALIQARAVARHSGRTFSFHDSEPEALQALGVAVPPARPVLRPPSKDPPPWPDLGVVDHVA